MSSCTGSVSRHFRHICLLCALAALASLSMIALYSARGQILALDTALAGSSHRQPLQRPWVLAGLASQPHLSLDNRPVQEALGEFRAYLQQVHRLANGEDIHTYCAQDNFNSEFVTAAERRYKNITSNENGKKLFVAVNLFNSEAILPNMVAQLLALADTLGRRQVFVSIYENGSRDRTKDILGRFNHILDMLGIEHRIVADDAPRPRHSHRIEYMAEIRNRALEPLYQNGAAFGRAVFINDMFFCLTDILELVYQSHAHGAHLTCAEDFEFRHGSLAFYDTWVSRDMLGHAFKSQIYRIADDDTAAVAQLTNRPFQVQCCWNGMAVIDTRVFAGNSALRFRRSTADECSASECSLLCNDMWAHGYRRAVVVPRVKLSYDIATRELLRAPYNFPRDAPFRDSRLQRIAFRPGPKTVYCNPLNGVGARNPDGSASLVALNIGGVSM